MLRTARSSSRAFIETTCRNERKSTLGQKPEGGKRGRHQRKYQLNWEGVQKGSWAARRFRRTSLNVYWHSVLCCAACADKQPEAQYVLSECGGTRADGATRWSSGGLRRCLSAFISPLHNSRKLIRGSEWLIEWKSNRQKNPRRPVEGTQAELFVAPYRKHGVVFVFRLCTQS